MTNVYELFQTTHAMKCTRGHTLTFPSFSPIHEGL